MSTVIEQHAWVSLFGSTATTRAGCGWRPGKTIQHPPSRATRLRLERAAVKGRQGQEATTCPRCGSDFGPAGTIQRSGATRARSPQPRRRHWRGSIQAAQAVPTKCWPCKSNSVCLGSSPRASKRVGGLRAFGRGSGRRANPTTLLLGAASARFRPTGWLGLLTEPEPLTDLRHKAGHGETLRPLQSR